MDIVIKGGTVLLPDPKNPLEVREETVDIGIQKGRIAEIGFIESKKARHIISAKHLHILPGLMDCQVHFREPGMEHKENFESGSLSALLGGLTGVFEMPNTNPPTTTEAALNDKRSRAEGRFYCDYSFFVGASPENTNFLHQLEKKPACCGVKVFMGSSTGNLLLDSKKDLETVVKNGQRRMAIHCEDEKSLIERKKFIETDRVHSHAIWRDEQTALKATKTLVLTAQKYNRPVHILHVTTEEEILFLSQYKSFASVEVTPQHLTLQAPSCYDKLGTLAQMNPPIRGERHFKALWKGVQNGIVDIIGSDHAPHTLEEKNQPYPQSPSGMPGTGTLLPLLLHHRTQGRLDLKSIVKLLAVNPSRLFKIKDRGSIRKNFLAHFTFVDLKKEQTITHKKLAYKCGWSPFEGMKITGWPQAVMLYGQTVMRDGEAVSAPQGREIEFE